MRTIRDAREELSNEIKSPSSIISDSYTSENINDTTYRPDENEDPLEEGKLGRAVRNLQKQERKKEEKKNQRYDGPNSCRIK